MFETIKRDQHLDSLHRELWMLEAPVWVDSKTQKRIDEIKAEIARIEKEAV